MINRKNNTYVIDIDGTICPIISKKNKTVQSYIDLIPYQYMIDKINKLYDEGHYIIFFTARGMNTYDGNLELINANVKPILEKWLNFHQVKYHELVMGKPWGANVIYIDDSAIHPEDFCGFNYRD